MTRRTSTLWTFAITLARAVHGLARQPRRHDGDPGDPRGSRRVARAARVDGERLHPDVRGAAAHRRRARRPVRAAADVRHRPRDLHPRLRRGRRRAEHRGAQRRARGAGPRRRDRDAADPDAARAAVPPEKRGLALGAWGGIGGLAIAFGPLVGGAVVEGIAWQWIFWLNVPIGLVLVPLALPPARGEPRPGRPARPARPRARERRPVRDRLGARARQRPGLDEPGDRRLARRRRRSWSPRSSPGSCVRRPRCCRCASSRAGRSRSRTRRRS